MTVKALPRDTDGSNLDTAITTLQSQISKTSNTLVKEQLNLKLRQAQVELVDHYMARGRLDPASILSTMS